MATTPPPIVRVRVRSAGCQDFELELSGTATVAELKIEATCGCDIDPEMMRIIFRGKVLRDEDSLAASGVDGKEPVHVARGRAAPPAAVPAVPDKTVLEERLPPAGEAKADSVRIRVQGPRGVSEDIEVPEGLRGLLQAVRSQAAALCGLSAQQAHILCRGKVLPDGADITLAACGIRDGDVVHVARRAEPQKASGAVASPVPAAQSSSTGHPGGAPMPMAWGSAPATIGGLPNQAAENALLEMARAQLAAAQPARNNPVPFEVQIGREVRLMERQVRYLVAERRRLEAATAGSRRSPGVPQPLAPPVDGDTPDDEEDPELLAEIARTMAEARARGAPVPMAAAFVDRALGRAHAAQALSARLEREGSGLQPELEDALAAAELAAAAASRAQRLGGGGASADGNGSAPP